MPGYSNRPATGYLENEYAPAWPGIIANLPANAIPPGALTAQSQSSTVTGRLQPQPGIFPVTGSSGLSVSVPAFAVGENVCAIAALQPPGSQQGFTVIITNKAVYADWILQGSVTTQKLFSKIYTFPTTYPRYARFGYVSIGNVLYFSSSSLLGVYALAPTFSVESIQVTNPGGYFTSAPTVVISDGAGTGATATAMESGGDITAVTVTLGGSGYVSPPIISFDGGSTTGPTAGQAPAAAIGILSTYASGYIVREISAQTGVAQANVTAAGSGYVNPQVAFIGGGGTGAAGQVFLNSSNQVSGVMITSFGINYTSAPTMQIIDSTGTGATATCTLFNGKPFIGGDFMASLAGRLLLANITGGDGNNTTGVASVVVTNGGGNYNLTGSSNFPTVDIVGGNGYGAKAYPPPSSVSNGPISAIDLGASYAFTGSTTSGSNVVSNVSSFNGLIVGMTVETGDLPSGTKITALNPVADTLTVSNNATASASNALVAYNYNNDSGYGYSSTPTVSISANAGAGAQALAQLSPIVAADSSTTHYPDRIAWSAPNSYGFFDPNFLANPGGYDSLSEARGILTSLNCVESVGWIGHNGGITEITPNTASAAVPFGFYPLWGEDELQIVRYGSAAQFGSTVCFLAMDSAWQITPSGVSEIGQNVAPLLRDVGLWNDGGFPLQGLYGSIVEISGEKHYLIGFSADDQTLAQGNGVRSTLVFDYNMNEGNWNTWSWSGITLTCPIAQSLDTQSYTTSGGSVPISRDSWILTAFTVTAAGADQANLYEVAPLNRAAQLTAASVTAYQSPTFNVQFRTESPSIARMLQERRIAFEYENLQEFTTQPASLFVLNWTLAGQQDPTQQTGSLTYSGTVYTIPKPSSSSFAYNGSYVSGGARTIYTGQADFFTFSGVCTSLQLQSSSLISLVRLTQVSTLPKAEIT